MKCLTALIMAVAPLMAMNNLAEATEKEPDPLSADIQLVVPDQSAGDDAEAADIHDYQYGDKMDVHKVISIESDSAACGMSGRLPSSSR